MPKTDRKAAIAAYKEVKPVAGIYMLLCAASGEAWVGESRNLAAQETSLRFSLRQLSHPNRTLLAAAQAHGPDSLTFEVLEVLADDDTGAFQRSLLRQRSTAWIEQLGATRL